MEQESLGKIRATLNALVSIANGAPWQPYAENDSDTRSIVTRRLGAKIMEMVIDLNDRNAILNPGVDTTYQYFTDLQWHILECAAKQYGTSIGTWEPDKIRVAQELVNEGFMSKELDYTYGRAYIYYITLKGRQALATRTASTGLISTNREG